MAREDLEKRGNWQKTSSARGQSPEDVFSSTFKTYFRNGSSYELIKRPKMLKNIYADKHGIVPDHAIRHKKSGRMVFVELKRQRNEGNAHERACKYLAPGIIKAGHKASGLAEGEFPFWLIFSNGLAKNQKYRREITFWFNGQKDAFTLWDDLSNPEQIIRHFEQYIVPKLGS